MQTPDQPRLAVVDDLRRAIADLVLRAREHDDRLEKIEAAQRRDVIWRIAERKEREKRTVERRFQLIRNAAAHFGPNYPEAIARQIERLFDGAHPPPPVLADCVEQLRDAYGQGGPSRSTVRRALSKFPNE